VNFNRGASWAPEGSAICAIPLSLLGSWRIAEGFVANASAISAMVSQGWALLASLQLADVALGVAKFIRQFLLAPATSDA
jgi:hypothetical protein